MSEIKTLKKIHKCCGLCGNHRDYTFCDKYNEESRVWNYCEAGFDLYHDQYYEAEPSVLHGGATVKVRAAVAIKRDGEWAVAGFSGEGDDMMVGAVADMVDGDDHSVRFITAEVPIPKRREIEGDVE